MVTYEQDHGVDPRAAEREAAERVRAHEALMALLHAMGMPAASPAAPAATPAAAAPPEAERRRDDSDEEQEAGGAERPEQPTGGAAAAQEGQQQNQARQPRAADALRAMGPLADALPPLMREMLQAQGDRPIEELIAQMEAMAPSRPGGPPPASRMAIQEQTAEAVACHKTKAKQNECPVCREEFALHQDVRKMECGHVFHDDCLIQWLERHNTCPLCRHELPTLDHDYEERKREQREAADGGRSARQRQQELYDSLYM
eukprot:tig00000571_g2158.t1